IHDNGGTANGGVDTSSAKTFTITITPVNDQPTLDPIGDETVNEDAAQQTVSLSGIGSGAADESQTLSVTASSSNTALIPNPTIVYTSPNTTGSLNYTPVANQFGTVTITVSVKDNGGTANGGIDTKTRTFTVTIDPVNDVPSFTKGANQSKAEDSGPQTTAWATAISPGPSNESTQTVNFIVINDNEALFTAGGQPAVSPTGTLTYTSAPNASGSATVTVKIHDNGGTANGGVDTSAAQTFTIAISAVNDAPTVSIDPPTQGAVQYSDPIVPVKVSGRDVDSLGSSLTASTQFKKDAGAFGAGLPTGLTLTAAAGAGGNPATTADPGTRDWTLAGTMKVQSGTYVVRVTVTDGSLSSYTDITITVTKEDASIDYTGDTVGLTGSTGLTLRATVWDSAAAGSGFPEDTTIGDITKMYVQFDIYSANSCGTGTPTATKTAPVLDTGTLADGIGTATAAYTSSSEASYCVVVRLIGSLTVNSVNAWYQATNALGAVITFYNNTGQFVTGGGWILDPAGGGNGKGNFGFNARFNNSGAPQGQMVYVYRGLYNGQLADYRIKSNSLTSLGFSCWNGTAYGP
ncbi:MAG: putative Ig domain-containing protein, partial [Actinobacteria bacterium]|nr:putative Ig domain-containing protein [Actinomycetota bacterium]